MTKIASNTFIACTELVSVTIPDNVIEIRSGVFRKCSSLNEVYCESVTPPIGTNSMFYDNAIGRKIYVPASDDDSIINAYKAAEYWSEYADDIVEYEF